MNLYRKGAVIYYNRRAHYIKRNHKTLVPRAMCWVDTEALNEEGKPENGKQELYFGCAIYERYSQKDRSHCEHSERLRFTTAAEFWDWIDSKAIKGRSLTIFAHNWNYDAAILNTSNLLPKLGWEIKKYVNEKPPVIVSWSKNNATITMLDTLNFFHNSLAELGDSIGIPKLELPSGEASIEEWDIYTWRDVEIIRAAVLSLMRFIEDNDLGNFQVTAASQAYAAYRHKYMTHTMLVHNNKLALELERSGYHGGRTEAFYRGTVRRRLYKLDINSMYPAIMRDTKLGFHFEGFFLFYNEHWWKKVRGTHSVVANCDLDTDEACYPVKDNGRLIFPIGQFNATLTTAELDYAESKGHIVQVNQWAYHKRDYLFTDWVDDLFNLRLKYKKAGNEVYSFFCKLLSNSLYGRFGMTGRFWNNNDDHAMEDLDITETASFPDGTRKRYRSRLGQVQELDHQPESRQSMPMIAAEITGYARMYLWQLITVANEGNVYYCDTDSLIVNKKGYDNLYGYIHPSKLGYLKVEEVTQGGTFIAPKHYKMGSKVVIKGIKRHAKKVDDSTYIQDRFTSWDAMLGNAEDGYVQVDSVTKHLSGENKKRIVLDEGFTLPIRLPRLSQ